MYSSSNDEPAENGDIYGHINSISVLRSYRRLGLAKKLMLLSRTSHKLAFNLCLIATTEDAMASVYRASYVSLHVRKSNIAALGLYRDTLGFEVAQVESKYCQYSLQISSFSFMVPD